MRSPYVIYIAVLPKYRQECITALKERLGDSVALYASDAHLDTSVKTGIRRDQYTPLRMLRLGDKFFVQVGSWLAALRATSTIVDLNPRSATAWLLLGARRLMGRRTLAWGHLHPRRGAGGPTERLRRFMRKLASGTILYTYQDQARAIADLPGSPTWVAPNSLYRETDMYPGDSRDAPVDVLYVGRFESAKKVSLLLEGFVEFSVTSPASRLVLIGDGTERSRLQARAREAGIDDRVVFTGWIDDVEVLRASYSSAFCSVSPGFAGLGLTQSLGFGVPMVIAKDEPHAPEIELANDDCVTWFASDSPSDLAAALTHRFERRSELPLGDTASTVRQLYSAERMAEGLISAFTTTGADSRPREHTGKIS